MATIRRYPWINHFLGSPTGYVVHLQKGEVRHHGVGQAFWYRPSTSVLSEVPVDDQELPTLFHALTLDHQDVTVQANVTYRFADPIPVSARLDFAMREESKRPPRGREQVATIVGQLCQSLSIDHLATMTLAEALSRGIGDLRDLLTAGLANDERLVSTGIRIIAVRVLGVRPEAEVERALQMPVREQLQSEADRATYERRALAVERERAISENELSNQIQLAAQRERLVSQEGANARLEAEEHAAASLISARSQAEQRELASEAEAGQIRRVGEAEAAREAAALEAYRTVDQATLLALALRDAAGRLPAIESLTITPDMLTSAIAALTRVATRQAPSADAVQPEI